MARYRYRRYFRRRYKRFKGVATNQKAYQKARIDCMYVIKYPNADGEIGFERNNLIVNGLTSGMILTDSVYFNQIKTIWGYSKLTGVAYQIMPSPSIRNSFSQNLCIVCGWLFGGPDVANFQTQIANDNSVILNPFGPVRKYVSIKGATWWANAGNETGTGILSVFANRNLSNASNVSFIVKVSLYLTLAKSNL